MKDPYGTAIVLTVTRLMLPFMQLFALYVLVHGHYSPGGGFQAGAIYAASVVLARTVLGRAESQRAFPERLALLLAGLGILIYTLTGLIPMASGGHFLDHGFLPLDQPAPTRRFEGILWVETAIMLTVVGVFISLYDAFTDEE